MFGLRKILTFIIKVFLGWLKLVLGVVSLCFGFEWKISGEKGEIANFWQIQRSTPRRRSAHLSVSPRLGVGTHA